MKDDEHDVGSGIIEEVFSEEYAIDDLTEFCHMDVASAEFFRALDVDACWTEIGIHRQWLVKYIVDISDVNNGIFLETVSHDTDGIVTDGWVWASKAQRLIYYKPDLGVIYVIDLPKLRDQIEDILSKCGKAIHISTERDGKQLALKGIALPFTEMGDICLRRVELSEELTEKFNQEIGKRESGVS